MSYEEALRRLGERFKDLRLPTESVPVTSGLGRVCASPIHSRVAIPGCRVSAMDGFGVKSGVTRRSSSSNPLFLSVEDQSSPLRRGTYSGAGVAVYLSTGSEVPRWVDAVVGVEKVRIVRGGILVGVPVPKGKNIEVRGEDLRPGAKLVSAGEGLTPAKVSLLMGAGQTEVEVFRRARVGVLSIGEGLTGPNERRKGASVNNYAHMVCGYIAEMGAKPVLLGIAGERPEETTRMIRGSIGKVDLVVTIGGSSVGANDHTLEAISALPGAETIFHGVKLLPVRPTGLARVGGKPVCVVPARAISTALSFFLVVAPILNLMKGMRSGARPISLPARADSAFSNTHAADALFLVRLLHGRTGLVASPLRWGSNHSTDLAKASGFFRLGAGRRVRRGELLMVRLFPDSLGGAGDE